MVTSDQLLLHTREVIQDHRFTVFQQEMTDHKSDLGIIEGQAGGALQAVKPSSAAQEGQPDAKETDGADRDLGGNQKQQTSLDSSSVKFGSPFYDPSGDAEEEEIVFRAPGEGQGTTTIEAYRSNGARR